MITPGNSNTLACPHELTSSYALVAQGGYSSPTETRFRPYHSALIRWWASRSHGASALFGRKMGRRRLFGGAGKGNGAPWYQGEHHGTGRISHRLCGLFHYYQRGRPEYDSTVGAAARFQRNFNGNQPGDPAKAATVILQVAVLDEPPFRLLLGSDAVRIVEQADLARIEADRKWRHLSVSTDFEAAAAMVNSR